MQIVGHFMTFVMKTLKSFIYFNILETDSSVSFRALVGDFVYSFLDFC